MPNNILVMTYNLNFIIKRLEQLIYDSVDYEVNEKLRMINEKIYEISDLVETIEVLLE